MLDDPRGFCAAFTDGRYDLEALTSGLGSRLLILDAAFKLHNVAHVWALPLDALAILRQEHGFKGRDVDRVEVSLTDLMDALVAEDSALHGPASPKG